MSATVALSASTATLTLLSSPFSSALTKVNLVVSNETAASMDVALRTNMLAELLSCNATGMVSPVRVAERATGVPTARLWFTVVFLTVRTALVAWPMMFLPAVPTDDPSPMTLLRAPSVAETSVTAFCARSVRV